MRGRVLSGLLLLSCRLNVYGLHEVKVSGDGNCQVYRTPKQTGNVTFFCFIHFFSNLQFRALSDQMYKSPEYHKHVRKEIVKQVEHLSVKF